LQEVEPPSPVNSGPVYERLLSPEEEKVENEYKSIATSIKMGIIDD
jgi:hypothetical protein